MEAHTSIHQIFYSRIDLNPEILKKYNGMDARDDSRDQQNLTETHSQIAVQSELGHFPSSFCFSEVIEIPRCVIVLISTIYLIQLIEN